ncbi:xanthine dehydrogenase accessory protein XdhC [Pseudooceanicola sp. 216_PA32_1]|uniref:Xanthine dehydrogenase accessory protein XdhC n=1 Tax=Pseudooceanicola pacificus TaxID=2676438 RepID=A0A844WH98_9RHOB|nr:xanthine dehydrogenase accessory protein XdhC [Pseudooceanicola pacificus]MWB79819.1 xanthine dehydrogenase accessory protein XdhC [Pseudooceanicola pacificus]
MAFDADRLSALAAAHGPVVRVVVAGVRGSTPREAGAAMAVWAEGFEGTIGGGALELEAIRLARAGLRAPRVLHRALGPELGQCCGGAVTLVLEAVDADLLERARGEVVARPVEAGAGEMPLEIRRMLAEARAQGVEAPTRLVEGWLAEPVARPRRNIWIWGAGHVGRALVAVLSPLPGLAITWVDTGADRFPDTPPEGVSVVPAADPALLAAHAPVEAEHLVLTYSHALDLALCDALLRRGFGRCGLIGSATKWARFRRRLSGMGHADAQISRIDCPIGDPSLGKHPQAIAVGVATCILAHGLGSGARQDARQGKIA